MAVEATRRTPSPSQHPDELELEPGTVRIRLTRGLVITAIVVVIGLSFLGGMGIILLLKGL
jgi:hypothetical protein